MGRLYAQLAASEGNKNDYVNKAIQHYREALRLDPSANIIFEELTDLYIQTNRLADAVTQAEDMLKQNPDNLDARRMLGPHLHPDDPGEPAGPRRRAVCPPGDRAVRDDHPEGAEGCR